MKSLKSFFTMFGIISFILVCAGVMVKAGTNNLQTELATTGIDQCEIDRSCCKDLGNSPNKLCWRNDKKDWSTLSTYDINNDYIDSTSSSDQIMFQHYKGGNWACVEPLDYANSKMSCGQFRTLNYRPSSFQFLGGSTGNWRWTPVKLMSSGEYYGRDRNNTDWWVKYESEQHMDKYSVIDYTQFKVLRGGEIVLSASNLPSNYVYETTISGGYCGIRYSHTGSSVTELSRTYQFVNVLNKCPDRIEKSSNEIKIFYNMKTNNNFNITQTRTLIKVDNTDLNVESSLKNYFLDYYAEVQKIKDDYTHFIQNYNYPYDSTNEQIDDYFHVLYNHWFNSYQDVITEPSSKLYVGGESKEIFTPNYKGYYQLYIWDGSQTLLSEVASIKSIVDETTKKKIKGILEIWAKNAVKAPTPKLWLACYGTNYLCSESSQPAELYTPIVLESYKKGIITKEFMCGDMYLSLKSHYLAYNQKFSANGGYLSYESALGRDGTDMLYQTSASTDAMAGFALMSVGLATIAEECNIDMDVPGYVTNYNNVKLKFEDMWSSRLGMYVNLDYNHNKYESANNIRATPYGNFIAIIAGIVPKDRIEMIYSSMESHFTYNNMGYTSATNDFIYFNPAGTNNGGFAGETFEGPVWEWVDNVYGLLSMFVAKSRDGLDVQIHIDKLKSWNYRLIGSDSPFPKESYNPSDLEADAEWDSVPYSPAGVSIPISLFDFNVFKNYDYSLFGYDNEQCTPTTEVCDNIDNDCDGQIDEGVTTSCMNYNTCVMQTGCNLVCLQYIPTDTCDGKDNDCDGTVDEGCNCVNGQTKQCGTSNVGECRYGSQTCTNGLWDGCVGNIEPVNETQDGKDNDCDGAVDEDFTVQGYCPNVWDVNCYKQIGLKKSLEVFVMFIESVFLPVVKYFMAGM
jgi:hypothetical protein